MSSTIYLRYLSAMTESVGAGLALVVINILDNELLSFLN